MDLDWNEDEMQEIAKLNGRTVAGVLASMKNKATATEVSDYIINHAGVTEHTDLVHQEVRRVLDNGVRDGFMVKIGNNYATPSLQDIYHVDADEGEEDGDGEGASGSDTTTEDRSDDDAADRFADILDMAADDPRLDAIIDDPAWDAVHDVVDEYMNITVQINDVGSSDTPVINMEIDRGSNTQSTLIDVQTDDVSSSSTEC